MAELPSPKRKPTSPHAVVRSDEFLDTAEDLHPLALLGRHADIMMFHDQDFQGAGAIHVPSGQPGVLDEQPLMRRIIEEYGRLKEFEEGGFTIMTPRSTPKRNEPKTFGSAFHEMGHVAFRRFPGIRQEILTPEGRFHRFNGVPIGEEAFLQILSIRSGLETDIRSGVSQQLRFLRYILKDPKLTKKKIFDNPEIKEMLSMLDYMVEGTLGPPQPIRVGIGR
tara:strand:+ start:324 stop:989 length:666 start_codon:yes stop_codon:yes gene_type:complete